MAQALTLARPYARAAFELARAAAALPAWSRALVFAAEVAQLPRVAQLRNDPRVVDNQVAALHLSSEISGDSPFAHFLSELAQRRRLVLLPEIAALYEEFKRDSESQLLVKITSARTLDAAQCEQLKASLRRRCRREIELETRVDPALLGGVVVDTGFEVIDGSARGRLERLAGALMNS